MLKIVDAIRTLKEATNGITNTEDLMNILAEMQAIKGGLADVTQAVDVVLTNEESKVGQKTTEMVLAETLQQLKSAVENLSKPKRIIKDANGNIIGAETVEAIKKVRK